MADSVPVGHHRQIRCGRIQSGPEHDAGLRPAVGRLQRCDPSREGEVTLHRVVHVAELVTAAPDIPTPDAEGQCIAVHRRGTGFVHRSHRPRLPRAGERQCRAHMYLHRGERLCTERIGDDRRDLMCTGFVEHVGEVPPGTQFNLTFGPGDRQLVILWVRHRCAEVRLERRGSRLRPDNLDLDRRGKVLVQGCETAGLGPRHETA